ncbi:helix-turn-helix domain-containing protein [Tenacibaculum jejuense]|uniref:Putative Bacterial regulatory helix-turn-helix protein, AraC family n=1 Tax=Tenacibaculum jejuense TaxID=584609 RepID=A0A238U6M9_9FLAO|nr:helix-turn-helix domain-containing protein [Tenacibaculum jejuense]SNR14248.1 putative Bacterial regulatory helix-turn-helix protein, AraC family [Tenacibaculum jejuense]
MMDIKTITPSKVSGLSKYICFYYELELDNENYYAFPSSNNVICIFEQADVNYASDCIHIKKNSTFPNSFTALNKYTKPLLVKSEGKVREFVIIFKPFGLSQFTTADFTNSPFFHIDEFADFLEQETNFFELSVHEKIKVVESYLHSKLNEKKELDLVIQALNLLEEEKLNIKEIAKELNCSYKKMYRLFITHCRCSPTVLRNNIRFRNILETLKTQNKNFKLSDIAFDEGFYDQASFNRMFKNQTGITPKKFFKEVSVFSKKNIYFKNIKEV